jgi:signal transduction histidine kinase
MPPESTDPAAENLAGVLERQRKKIVARWVELVRGQPETHYRERSAKEVSAWLSPGLDAFIEVLATGSPERMEEHLHEVSLVRLGLGFGIDEVATSLMLLEEAAKPFVLEASPPGPETLRATMDRLSAGTRDTISRFSALYAQAMRGEIEERERRTTLMFEAAETAGASLDLEEVLSRVSRYIARALGVSHCHVYLSDAERDVYTPRKTDELDREPCRAIEDRPLDPKKDAAVSAVVRGGKPGFWRTRDAGPPLDLDPSTPVALEGAAVLPIAVGERLLGLAVVFVFDTGRTFADEQIELAWGVCNAVASAVENARLHEETRRQLEESRSLQKVTEALLEKLHVDELLEMVCREARMLTGADDCRVSLANDADAAVGIASAGPTGNQGECTRLSVPLRGDGESIGALLLVRRSGRFTRNDERLVGLFAHQAAIALESARLRTELEKVAVLEERQRLARDLHDSVTQSLYAVSLYSEAAARLLDSGDPEQASAHLRDVRATSVAALREMRLLLFELQPSVLETEGLAAALQSRLTAVEERVGLQTDMEVEGNARPARLVEEQLHRIAQEALNNALKHACAAKITVRLRQTTGEVNLSISDDGVGFDPQKERPEGSYGLRGMQERATTIGADLSIRSEPGQGTTVQVSVREPAAEKTPSSGDTPHERRVHSDPDSR